MNTRWTQRVLPAAATLAVGAALACAFAGSLTPPTPAAADAAQDAAKTLFTDKCGACHNLPNPGELMYTRREWQDTVDEMLYQHGALYNPQTKSGITTDQADEIVGYLAQFAPKPGRVRVGPSDSGLGDVWTSEPLQSRSFTFTSDDSMADFDQDSGVWKIVPSETLGEGYLKARPGEGDSSAPLLVEKKDPITGDLDLQTSFKLFAGTSPAVGLVLDCQDSRHYALVEYAAATHALSFATYAGEAPSNSTSITLPQAPVAGPGGWHSLRVIEHNNGQSIEVWLDYQKSMTTSDPSWASNGYVGLWTGEGDIAAFRNLTLDIYPPLNSPAEEQ